MKKIALVLLTLTFVLSTTLFVTACGKQETIETSSSQSQIESNTSVENSASSSQSSGSSEDSSNVHKHTFSEQWTYDSDYHWHVATCEHTQEVSGKAGHIFDSNNVCSVCSYDKTTPAGYFTFTLLSNNTYEIKAKNKTNLPTEIVIPSRYNGKLVTSIGSSAFRQCFGLTSVTIPNSVTSIGDWAFESCSGLTSVTIGNSVTNISSSAFNRCRRLTSISVSTGNSTYHSKGNCLIETATKTLVLGCKNSVIPTDGSVTSIGENSFYGCSGLTSVTIPNSVTSIGGNAFMGCSGLISITIPDSVTSIGGGVFYRCSGLESVTIGNSVTSIGNYAFAYCSGLTSVTFENTTGWWYSPSSTATSGTAISSDALSNPSTAATYLKNDYYWKRS